MAELKMKKAKIAIVDSGISQKVWYKEDILGGVSFFIEDSRIYMSDEYDDCCGHGTNCASIIKKYCRNAEFYIVKIMQDELVCSSKLLFLALKHLREIDVDYINLSLSIGNSPYIEEIENELRLLGEQGKKIIASVQNGKRTSYPANSMFVQGVRGELLFNQKMKENSKETDIQYIADYAPELVQSIKNEYAWFGGNSKATALATGHLSQSDKKGIVIKDEKNESKMTDDKQLVFVRVKHILQKHMSIGQLKRSTKFWAEKECLINNINEFMINIENEFQISFLLDDINYYNFSDVDSLLSMIIKKVRNNEDSSKSN